LVSHIKRRTKIDKRVLRRIYASKRGQVMGGQRILYNEEFKHFYSSPNEIKENKLDGTCNVHGEDEMQPNFSLENLKGRDHFKDLRHRW
jgi:hypothetical protein